MAERPTADYDAVPPWHGQRFGTAACLHFGAVQVTSIVTGEPLSRWCPNCDGTQYTRVIPPERSTDA